MDYKINNRSLNALLKQLILLFLLIFTTHCSYSMNKITKTEEEMFQDNLAKLREPLTGFVNDFKTWSKRDQDKIKLFSNSGGVSFGVQGRPLAARKYNGSIIKWLEGEITQDQIIPFFLVLDYLKKQNK